MRYAESYNAGEWSKAVVSRVRIGNLTRNVCRQVRTHHAVAHSPTSHGVGFGKTVEQNAALLRAVDRHDGKMLTFEDQATVDLVSQNQEIAPADRTRNFVNVILREDAAGGILR